MRLTERQSPEMIVFKDIGSDLARYDIDDFDAVELFSTLVKTILMSGGITQMEAFQHAT